MSVFCFLLTNLFRRRRVRSTGVSRSFKGIIEVRSSEVSRYCFCYQSPSCCYIGSDSFIFPTHLLRSFFSVSAFFCFSSPSCSPVLVCFFFCPLPSSLCFSSPFFLPPLFLRLRERERENSHTNVYNANIKNNIKKKTVSYMYYTICTYMCQCMQHLENYRENFWQKTPKTFTRS